jgi:predicted nucleotide-binding protein
MLSLARDGKLVLRHYATDDELTTLRGQDPPTPGAAPLQPPSTAAPAPSTARRVRRATTRTTPGPARPAPKDSRKVFVVHGRDTGTADELFAFLRAIGLDPIEWSKAKLLTGKAQPSVPEIVEAAFREAAAVLVLLTPDDLVVLKAKFRKRRDPPYEKRQTGQARPNVLFEAGLAFGYYPTATVLVMVGDVKPFSDVSGLYIIRLDSGPASRQELVDSLRIAGAEVDIEGKTQWFRVGNFEVEED